MNKELCIVHANCQGEPLLERLRACPGFHERYECILITNYTREPMPDHALGQCSLFLYQFLGPKWESLASETLLGKLPGAARSLCIPNMFFTGYWPTWSGKAGFDFRCSHLDSLLDLGLPDEETIMLYLRTDMAGKFDLDGIVEASLATERARQEHTPVRYVEMVEENFSSRRLYNTVNHPGTELMNHAARGVLRELGFEPPEQGVLDALGEPFSEFELPVHPSVAVHFGWDFAGPDTVYNVYGRPLTFARYAANYVMARRAGVTDFIGFLQGERCGG